MEFCIYYKNTTAVKLPNYEKDCNSIALTTFKQLKKQGNFIISLTLVNDQKIHEINKQYRNIDRPTDVISFAYNDQNEKVVVSKGVPNDLGEITISIDTAKRQAEEYDHSLKRELCFLFLHGLLHLLGYDHHTPVEEKVMFSLQDEILSKLDI